MTIRAIAATAALLVPLAAIAQGATPGPVPLPWTLPPGNSVTPPAVEPPVVPAPDATPAPTPTPRRTARPQPTATPTSTATPRPRPAPSPTPEAVPTAEPTAVTAAPTAEPEPAEVAPVDEPTPEPSVAATGLPPAAPEAEGESRSSLLWVLLAALLIAALAALLFWRRGKAEGAVDGIEAAPEPVVAPVPVVQPEPVAPVAAAANPEQPRFLNRPVSPPEPASTSEPEAPSFLTRPTPAPEGLVVSTAFRRPPAVPEAPAADRAPLDFTFLPLVMGTEGDKAVVRFELGAANPTDVPVPELRFAAGLFGASPQQDADLERFFAEMPPHAQLQPFPIAAGEPRKLEATVSLPLDNLPALTAGERRFFVPVMAIDARYRWADGREARTRVAFVVGRQIQGSDKLAPVFLDRGDRMVDRLEARVHGEVRRD
ncbi:hypothetical protein LK533_14000 [Sphingomonas sp. PL-96]|uniref:hypothetical protein n=1 Tax=Sphingomonas sp. PL-96 TaxID=2887201 RepID=UPI001E340672|nr:hypothetical protein [Sphingomonas sp. PL-96]MCC2977784.1 hypothetical protein [Sphingomonas sp. PL-96]